MRCPKCGKENPEDAGYCDSCLTNLKILKRGYEADEGQAGLGGPVQEAARPAPYQQPVVSAPAGYHSPSEWREVAPREALRPAAKAAGRRLGGVKLDWAIYGGLALALMLSLLLMVLFWGNPMPSEVADSFIKAANNKDAGAMLKHVYSPSPADEARVNDIAGRIGEGGGFSDLKYRVDETDQYFATVYITQGKYSPGGTGFAKDITEEDRLSLAMENHEGHWYVNVVSSRLLP